MLYHKIKTMWKRDPETKHKTLLEGQWQTPEFEALRKLDWIWTEKVDGTNVRVIYDGDIRDGDIRFGGRTENAQMHSGLVNYLKSTFFPETFAEVFGSGNVTLFGEGFGAKIQKGGGNYRRDQGFVLFDVMVGDWWLRREDVEDVAEKLRIPVVPVVGTGPLNEMADYVRAGPLSTWGNFPSEGVVARPPVELSARGGARIITKLKTKDFR